MKRILAILGIIILVSLYVLTLVFALTDDPKSMNFLGLSIGATVVIPVLLWVAMLFFKGRDENKKNRGNM